MSNAPTIALGREDEHFASLRKAMGIQNIGLNTFPDPDVVLRRTGKGLRGLRELLFDDQLETVWNARLSSLTQSAWSLVGGDSRREKEAFRLISDILDSYPVKAIMEGMMEAVAYGFSPLEILWETDNGRWIPTELIPKPTEWFSFDRNGSLRLRCRWSISGEIVPPNKFLLVQHRAKYDNPYGEKLFSKVYWPVILKKNGIKWWTRFIEKFGSPALVGKYDQTAREKQREEMLEALDMLTASSVAAISKDAEISTLQDADKRGSGAAHTGFADFQNKAIAKVILGQTLTTETAANGNRSLGEVHQSTKDAITFSDQDMTADAFNRLFRLVTDLNFAEEVAAPRMVFERPANLKTDRVARDEKLYEIGVRFNKTYFARHYDLEDDLFEIYEEEAPPGFSAAARGKVSFANSRSESDMAEFLGEVGPDGQALLEERVDKYLRDFEKANSFKNASKRLLKRFERGYKYRQKLTGVFDNLRYVAGAVGDRDG